MGNCLGARSGPRSSRLLYGWLPSEGLFLKPLCHPGPRTIPIAGQPVALPTDPHDPRMAEIVEMVKAELKKSAAPEPGSGSEVLSGDYEQIYIIDCPPDLFYKKPCFF
jgi:hypothetical protein